MAIYFVCSKCGFYQEASPDDVDVQHHCNECGEPLIQKCPNKLCPLFIENLNNKFCSCGQDWSFLKKTSDRFNNDDFCKKRPY